MAIERLSFAAPTTDPEGLPKVLEDITQDYFFGLLQRYPHLITQLPRGNYPLTPRSWPEGSPEYDLEVTESGIGIMTVNPGRNGLVATLYSQSEFGLSFIDSTPSKKTILIPDNFITSFITHTPRSGQTGRIYEVIYHTAGAPMPKAA